MLTHYTVLQYPRASTTSFVARRKGGKEDLTFHLEFRGTAVITDHGLDIEPVHTNNRLVIPAWSTTILIKVINGENWWVTWNSANMAKKKR